MTTRRLLAVLFAVIAATAAFTRARRAPGSDDATRAFDAAGVVTAAPADGRVTIAHDAIPGYMPAMTMPFALGPDVPPSLSPGDRVRFLLRVADEWSRVERVAVVGRDAAVANAAAAAAAAPRLKQGDALPAFSLTTSEGRTFTDADLRGRLTAVTFIYTRCPLPEFCPLMVKRFQQLQAELAQDRALANVRLASVTLDPANDTPAVLAAYASAMGAQPERWQFLTGDAAQLARLTNAFSIHVERNGFVLDHTLATAIVGPDGRLVQVWRGNGWRATDLLEVLRREATTP